jgi:hypothetical protein
LRTVSGFASAYLNRNRLYRIDLSSGDRAEGGSESRGARDQVRILDDFPDSWDAMNMDPKGRFVVVAKRRHPASADREVVIFDDCELRERPVSNCRRDERFHVQPHPWQLQFALDQQEVSQVEVTPEWLIMVEIRGASEAKITGRNWATIAELEHIDRETLRAPPVRWSQPTEGRRINLINESSFVEWNWSNPRVVVRRTSDGTVVRDIDLNFSCPPGDDPCYAIDQATDDLIVVRRKDSPKSSDWRIAVFDLRTSRAIWRSSTHRSVTIGPRRQLFVAEERGVCIESLHDRGP